ncbi:MAG: O-antigen ligase family protein [Bacteroidetes bacterium]|nr:O-antigen ligase family protein [Bacteroidota bacterium]MCW5896244.1 O-antigen ligase family protein [Bacteroidota bacterium]
MDAFVQPIITTGPWKIAYLSGLLYLAYFTMYRYLDRESSFSVMQQLIYVATAMSVLNLLQVFVPSFEIIAGTRSEVGESFVRYQSVYYHFSVLSILFIVYLLSNMKVDSKGIMSYAIMGSLNFITVIITGYRATLFVLLACLGIYLLRFWSRLHLKAKLVLFVLLLPFLFYIYSYTVERNIETTESDETDTSLVYRLIEAGMGIDKLTIDDSWIWGIGYADGFLNEWGGVVGGQETYFLHNGYLSILYNYGVVGSIAWTLLMLTVLVFIVRYLKRMWRSPIYVLLSLYLVGQFVVNYSSGVFNREPSVTFCFFLALALLEKTVKYSNKEDQWQPVPQNLRRVFA